MANLFLVVGVMMILFILLYAIINLASTQTPRPQSPEALMEAEMEARSMPRHPVFNSAYLFVPESVINTPAITPKRPRPKPKPKPGNK